MQASASAPSATQLDRVSVRNRLPEKVFQPRPFRPVLLHMCERWVEVKNTEQRGEELRLDGSHRNMLTIGGFVDVVERCTAIGQVRTTLGEPVA